MSIRRVSWSAIALAAALGSPFVVGGCTSSSAETETRAPCDANPELSLRTRSAISNGQNLNGDNLNGSSLNGQNLNGIFVNGGNLNGQNLNGQNLNGIRLNGQNLNGDNLNGQNLNGQNLNGDNLNGQNLNGVAMNELVARTNDGHTLSGAALVGTRIDGVLSDGSSVELTITAFQRSADGKIAYYEIQHEGQSICPSGELGLFVPGAWDATAARHERLSIGDRTVDVSFSCANGAIAKCVAWGYDPFAIGPDLHQTCTRMVRADYCGTGIPFTKDGTMIDVFDTRGVQTPTNDASFSFEAAWGTNGAVCVNRTRFDAHDARGAAVAPSCWANLPRCSSLAEASTTYGATIANASRPQSRTYCE